MNGGYNMNEKINVKAQENLIKSFAVADNMVEKFWDMWQLSLGSMSWSQEQLESMAQKYLDQRKLAREECSKVMEELMKQVKNNQVQLQTMVQQAVKTTFENVDIPVYNFFEDLNKKVEALSKKVDTL
jgi:polyhydroxyalkanoate synthesis regulator phasin